DHGLVDRESGIRIDDLVTLFDQREDGKKDNGLAAGHDTHMLRSNRNAASLADVLRDHGSEIRIPLSRPVVSPTFIERLLGCVDHMGRGFEIGLTDLQVNDATALGFERTGLYQDLERCLNQDAVHPRGKFHCEIFRKNGTPSRSSASITTSSIETLSPETRPVIRVPFSSVTMMTW